MEIKKIIVNLEGIYDQLYGEEWKESVREAIEILKDQDEGKIFKRFIQEHYSGSKATTIESETKKFEPLKDVEIVESLIEESESWEEKNNKRED